jgi:D-tyrosyl-tRNA(Tyr) deacylase
MRAVVQRVSSASVEVDGNVVGKIKNGLLVLIGVAENDDLSDVEYLSDKITNLRIFKDENGKMNLSMIDLGYEMLAVSQFTLQGDCRKGKRPNFSDAAKPEIAKNLYEKFIIKCREFGIKVETGIFQAHMNVTLVNDGPVTILLDSKKGF